MLIKLQVEISTLKSAGIVILALSLGHIPLLTETSVGLALRYLLLLFLLGCLFVLFIRRRVIPVSALWCYLSGLFIVFHGLLLTLQDIKPDVVEILMFLLAPFIYFLVGAYYSTYQNIGTMVKAMTVVMVLCSIQMVFAGALTSFETAPFVVVRNEHTVYSLIFGTVHRGGRYGSIFAEASDYAYASIIPLLYLIRTRAYFLVCLVFMGWALAASLTSFFVLAFIFGLKFGKMVLNRMRIPAFIASLLAIIFIGISVALVLLASTLEGLIDGHKVWSLGTKMKGFKYMFNLIVDNPFGIGIRNLNAIALRDDINLSGGYLEMGIFFGISGLIVLAFFFRCLQEYLKSEGGSIIEVVYLGLIGIFLGAMVHGPLFKAYWVLFFGAVESYRATRDAYMAENKKLALLST
ncbi:MAG: hypothetical protein COA42_00475 [Alteromonadaceae bacterium]|nr:MAG: hypothetical protein COA42_00475 [Alteromonadaceae bacterium]